MVKNPNKFTFKQARIIILFSVLVVISIATYFQQTTITGWQKPVYISLHAINGDKNSEIAKYIKELQSSDFQEIFDFLVNEGKAYDMTNLPEFRYYLGKPVSENPPKPPSGKGGAIAIMGWSLRLRYWLFMNTGSLGLDSRRIRLFIIYHDENDGQALAHSYGLRKGLVGVVHAYAKRHLNKKNNIIITHELLHTFGASDKYSDGGLPVYPDGYAEPDKIPLYPQEFAEIMAGRIPINKTQAAIPDDLSRSLIGPLTAEEINWY